MSIEEVLRWKERRDWLFTDIPSCPKCNAKSIKIVAYDISPALWQCRTCKVRFLYEDETYGTPSFLD